MAIKNVPVLSFASKQVVVSLVIDDVLQRMVGINVKNNTAEALWIGITGGKSAVIPANTMFDVPFKRVDEREIELNSVTLRRAGIPIRAAYPWFN